MATKAGFEPATFRTKGVESTNSPLCPTKYGAWDLHRVGVILKWRLQNWSAFGSNIAIGIARKVRHALWVGRVLESGTVCDEEGCKNRVCDVVRIFSFYHRPTPKA